MQKKGVVIAGQSFIFLSLKEATDNLNLFTKRFKFKGSTTNLKKLGVSFLLPLSLLFLLQGQSREVRAAFRAY